MKYNIIDLFAGCGGLLEGFLRNEEILYNPIASVEWEKAPLKNLKNHLKNYWKYKNTEEKCIHMDIQRTDDLFSGWENDEIYGTHIGLDKIVEKYNNKVDMIIGGPPCQAYSVAGRVRCENGMKNDYRNYLFESYLKTVNKYRPKLFIFENVPGMLSAKPGGVLATELISNAIKKIGYTVVDNFKDAQVDVSEYGVPQVRKRVIIVGLNKDYYKNPEEVLKEFYNKILPKYKIKKKKTVWDTIKDLEKHYPVLEEYKKEKKKYSHTFSDKTHENHKPRYHNKGDIEIFKKLAEDIDKGTNFYSTAKAKNQLYFERTGKMTKVHKYHVLAKDKPSTTILAHLYKDGLRFIHPDFKQGRSITVREAARLQSFGDEYKFISAQGLNYKMIGNAVPPHFSYILSKAIKEII